SAEREHGHTTQDRLFHTKPPVCVPPPSHHAVRHVPAAGISAATPTPRLRPTVEAAQNRVRGSALLAQRTMQRLFQEVLRWRPRPPYLRRLAWRIRLRRRN